MDERPYLWITQMHDGKLQAIAISEAQRYLLARLDIDLVNIPSFDKMLLELSIEAFRLPPEMIGEMNVNHLHNP